MNDLTNRDPNAEALPDTDFNHRFLLWICSVAAMGGLLFGYDFVVIGGAKPFYEPWFGLSDETPLLQGWAMSSALVGCLSGAILCGMLTDRWGRKWLLVLAALLFTLSAAGTALASSFTIFIVYRIIGGVGIGLASNLSPVYIAEIAPARYRGRLVSLNQLTIVIGILAAQIVNWLIAERVPDAYSAEQIRQSWNGTTGWRWMFAAELVPAIAFFVLMFWVPESPRWLLKSQRRDVAKGILERLGGADYAQRETRAIEAALAKDELTTTGFNKRLTPGFLRALCLGVFLALFQQWCGINVIFNYAEEVFRAAGYGVSGVMLNIVITGMVNFAFTLVGMMTVDRFGRRPLMLVGASGLALVYALLGWGFFQNSQGGHMLLLVLLAIALYASSLAPVTWVIISEIFPTRQRGIGVGASVFALWLGCTLLTLTFPVLNKHLGAHGTFWVYGLTCAVGFAVLMKVLPETRNRSLEEIEESFAATKP